MPTSSNDTLLIRALEVIGSIIREDELTAWLKKSIQPIFPHGAFICGVGRINPIGAVPIKVFTSKNFPSAYFQALTNSDGYLTSPVINKWLAHGGVQLFDIEGGVDASVDTQWYVRFKASGLQNIAAHGAYDVSRQHATYFSFHQVPRPLGDEQRRVLEILVPHMHAALLRILYKMEAVERRGEALTAREKEVLTWVSKGKTSSEIAVILGISSNTVKNQIQSILCKLRVNTRAQAVAKAITKGLVV